MKKFLVLLLFLIISFLVVFYNPFFKEFFITTSFTTMHHRYLAYMFYSDDEIYKVLSSNKVVENNDVSDSRLINVKKYHKSYKVINIEGKGYNGYLVYIYDPSKISIALSKYIGIKGEKITTVSKREKAVVSINAGGFFDPDWKSNGAISHGTVIKNSKIVSDYQDAVSNGGFIGFSKGNKLILGKFSKNKALEIYRDAVEFGPFLIVNGKSVKVYGNGGLGIAPRTAIGQRKDGVVLLLVINGRIPSSIGADMNDLISIFKKYGAINAANLDGGSSTELYVNGKILNVPTGGGSDGLRNMPVYFVVKR